MCTSVIFMLCVVITTNAFQEEIVRNKRQTFEIQDRWIWGYLTEKPDEQKTSLKSDNPMEERENKNNLTSNIQENKSTSALSTSIATVITSTSTETTTNMEFEMNNVSTTESVLAKAVSHSSDIRLLNASTTMHGNVTTIAPYTTRTLPSYCKRLVKPDFNVSGRRKYETQCMEYVWELYKRKREADLKPHCGLMFWKATDLYYVISGRKAENGEFPHMGAIGWKAAVGTWVFKCGSSLISPKFVLTAAHCSKASPKDSTISDPVPKIVRLGDKRITDKKGRLNSNAYTYPTDRNISRILIHPKYDPPMKYFDIALMELEVPVTFTNLIQPACLWNYSMSNIKNATLTGWGVIETGGLSVEAAPELMAATVDVLDNDQCDELLKDKHNRNWQGFQEHQMCAGKLEGGVDSCQWYLILLVLSLAFTHPSGDRARDCLTCISSNNAHAYWPSGRFRWSITSEVKLDKNLTNTQGQMHYIVGVISFGIGCAHKNLPGIYTRVSSFIDWIEDNVWKD